MLKVLFFILFTGSVWTLMSQQKLKSDAAMNHCAGAVNLFENGDFQLQFSGEKNESDLSRYSSLASLSTENVLWCSFVAQTDGKLTFNASVKQEWLQMVIFKEEFKSVCEDVANGVAEIQRLQLKKEYKTVGLDFKTGEGVLYAMDLKKGQHIQLIFATTEGIKQYMTLMWQFIPNEALEVEEKIVDQRDDDFAPTLKFKVLDSDVKQPVIANFAIEGGPKGLSGLYVGSEFYFNLDRNAKLKVKCDAEGYFFHDSLYEVALLEDQEIIIQLIRVKSGRTMQIEEIEFEPGTSEIKPASYENLRRLKDFLALNAEVHVEIQGHVFAIGDNSFAAQKVSEARAKRVMKYLIDNGISKDRLTAVGYGNTKPIYLEPRFYYEEQANRRVEVMIK